MLRERNIAGVLIYASRFRNSEPEALLRRLENLFKWVTYPILTKHSGDFSPLLLIHVCMQGRLSLWQEWAFALKSLPILLSIISIAAFLVSSSMCMLLRLSIILLGLRNGRLNFIFLPCFIMIYGREARVYCLMETLSDTGLKGRLLFSLI